MIELFSSPTLRVNRQRITLHWPEDGLGGYGHVRTTALGAVVPSDQAGPIDSGDLVFVNRLLVAEDRITQSAVIQQRNMELQEERARSDANFRLISAVLSTVSTIAAAITAVVLLTRENP